MQECQRQAQPGTIRSFHVYNLQDSLAHSRAETDRELAYRNYDLIDVGKTIMEYYSRKAPWEELRAYLDCVYDLADPNAPAGPGKDYQRIDKGPYFLVDTSSRSIPCSRLTPQSPERTIADHGNDCASGMIC